MKIWIVYAISSMFLAGLTAVIAKKGLEGISGDLGLTVRTLFVFLFTLIFAIVAVPIKDWSLLKMPNWLWLAGSAVTTTLSWIFYYNAIKLGEVSTVALIDKGSVVVAVTLAVWLLNEPMTVSKSLGALMIRSRDHCSGLTQVWLSARPLAYASQSAIEEEQKSA